MGLPGVTGDKEGYKGLRGDYWRLQGVTEGYKGLWRSSRARSTMGKKI